MLLEVPLKLFISTRVNSGFQVIRPSASVFGAGEMRATTSEMHWILFRLCVCLAFLYSLKRVISDLAVVPLLYIMYACILVFQWEVDARARIVNAEVLSGLREQYEQILNVIL